MVSLLNWPFGKESKKERPKENIKNQAPGLRIVLFGKDEIQKNKLKDFIVGETELGSLDHQSVKHCSASSTEWKGNSLTVVKTPDMFHISKDAVIQEMRNCVSLCPPGPNVLLLLANPSDFSEKDRQTLKFIVRLFYQDAFTDLMIINTRKGIHFNLPLNKVFRKCGKKIYNMADKDRLLLMTQIESIVHANNQSFLTLHEESIQSEHMKTPLNIVLCGTRRAEKTSAAGAILGRSDLHPVSDTSECVKLQAEVCGCRVSLVELPELYGRPLETVMKVSLSSVSLCDPEGVHVFILLLPVGPLTDEDKIEFETIMNTFGSQVKAFTMILFTVEADPSAPEVYKNLQEDKDIQALNQRCRGHFVLNIRDRQQIQKLLDSLEKHRAETVHEAVSYTTETFAQAQIEKIIQQAELKKLKQSSTPDGDMKQSPESLRIVLFGKTGYGKSSSGNTILGRKEFKAEIGQKSVTRSCQKAHGEVNGRPVTVVDTPGLFDTTLSHDDVYDEMIKCISLLAPGPHVFLLVLSISRFTEEEERTLKRIKEGFGGDVEKFTIVLLTGGDQLKHDNVSIDDYVETKCTDSFTKLIADCGGRYHLFDNRDDKNQTQVSELITKIDEMVKENGGSCYTNEMLQEAEASIKKEMEKLLKEKEEEMRQEMEKLKMKHEEDMKAMERKIEEQRAETEKQRKLREKELEEDMKEKIKKEKEERENDQKRREEEERRRKEQEEKQRQELMQKLAESEKQIQIKSEEKDMISRELQKTREELKQQQDNWEIQLKEWWEDRDRENKRIRHEEQTKLKKLEEEYKREKENDEKKRKEEDKRRQQQEEQGRKAMERGFERKIEEQRKETEKQRKLREKQLKETEENLNKERAERERDQKIREEDEKRRKKQEEIQRQKLRQKLADLEKQIQIKSEEKQMTDTKLDKTREKMKQERVNWEKQRKEWWEDRDRENKRIHHEEQSKLKKLEEEYKREKENDEKKRKEEDKLRQQQEEQGRKAMEEEYERKMEEQRKETEKQRQLREKQLKETEENLNKERAEREKDQKSREEEEKRRKEQEEIQRQKLRQKLADLEKQIQIKSEEKQMTDTKLDKTREELQQERDNWEKRRKEWWEDRDRENKRIHHEEQSKLKKLEEEYKREKENDEKKRKEEDKLRQQQEEQGRKTMEEGYERNMEDLKKNYEEEARKKAEELNDFKDKYTKHRGVINNMVKSFTKRRSNLFKINDLLEKHGKEIIGKTEEEKKVLQDKQDKEMSDLLVKLLAEDDPFCRFL